MKLIKPRIKDWISLYRLYLTAFPKCERKPVWLILSMCRKGTAEVLSIDDGRFLGLVITVLQGDKVLLDYFAVKSCERGGGIGSRALELIRQRYTDKRLLLEIETPDPLAENNADRLRRKSFYLRNGLSDTGIRVSLFGVAMELLTFGQDISFEEYLDIYRLAVGSKRAENNVTEIKG